MTEGRDRKRLEQRGLEPGDIIECIRPLLGPDDRVVVVHAGIWAIVNGRLSPEEVLEAIVEAVSGRTLVMPAFNLAFSQTRTFHWRDTPSEMGILSELFRKRPGVRRSPNAVTSWLASGPLQDEVCRDSGQWLWGETWDYLYEMNSVVIGFGVPLHDYASIVCLGEAKVNVPYRFFKSLRGVADYGNGPVPVAVRALVRRLDLPTDGDYRPVFDVLRAAGKVVSRPLGIGRCEAARARDIVETCRDLLLGDPLACLADKAAYQLQSRRPLFCFASSVNVDLLSAYFAEEYQEVTREPCRILRLPFAQYRQQILDEESDLRWHDPTHLVVFELVESVLGDLLFDSFLPVNEVVWREVIAKRVGEFVEVIRKGREVLHGVFQILNFEVLGTPALGLAANNVERGTREAVEVANEVLAQSLRDLPDTHLVDFRDLVRRFGASPALPRKYWYIGRIPFSRDFSKFLCRRLVGSTLALEHKTARLLILDLDNTLWGGVVGDDGPDALVLGSDYPGNVFRDFQRFLRRLSHRGVLLAVCSKNTEGIALATIRDHPGMLLRPDDFACIRINWRPKDENIREICATLGLGLENACVIDDNPVEREWIRAALPEVLVPELPSDPADWIEFLANYPYLETMRLTREDLGRTESYRAMVRMRGERSAFASLEDFYRGLKMTVFVAPLSAATRARALQLLAKTNQFNTTRRRYTERDLQHAIEVRGARVFVIGLEDKYTEPETIGLVITIPTGGTAGTVDIDTFLMSCRVLGRKVETAVLGWLTGDLRRRGFSRVTASVVPTDRNQVVWSLYTDHAFQEIGEHRYVFDLASREIEIPDWFRIEDPDVTCDDVLSLPPRHGSGG